LGEVLLKNPGLGPGPRQVFPTTANSDRIYFQGSERPLDPFGPKQHAKYAAARAQIRHRPLDLGSEISQEHTVYGKVVPLAGLQEAVPAQIMADNLSRHFLFLPKIINPAGWG
jgi:hypothetical protein